MQALTNLLFAALALVGKSHGMLVVAVVGEQLFGGMGSAAFVALLMALCDVRYTATQYALFSAVAALARVFIGPPAGYLVAGLGWPVFFTITFLASLPALVLIVHLGKSIRLLDRPAQTGVSQ
jgi:PAT family beta-lactamase induction signal transducer AmpG